MKKVFIDGSEGTTGLRIHERLSGRTDLEILSIDPALRKDTAERGRLLNAADAAILCLPDQAAREAVELIENPHTIVLDASTAHRTQEGWAYGFPELGENFRRSIASGKRIAVPGCHASGYVAIMHPLTAAGILPTDFPAVCHSLTGYSGGGKKMIAYYRDEKRSTLLDSPRQYALSQVHKHQPEMQKYGGLQDTPIFNPIVGDFYAGMEVTVPLHTRLMRKKMDAGALRAFFREYYAGQKMLRVAEENQYAPDGFLAAGQMAGFDDMVLYISGNEDRILISALFDNLGKGASGAAVQCLNIALGEDETTGLSRSE